jgi:hypothetical protein
MERFIDIVLLVVAGSCSPSRIFVVSRPVLRHRMIDRVRNQSRRAENRRAET